MADHNFNSLETDLINMTENSSFEQSTNRRILEAKRVYHSRIQQLFDLLALANMADSDHELVEVWQVAADVSQRNGFYGTVRASIVMIAGNEIVEHWEETNEVDFDLANRNEEIEAKVKQQMSEWHSTK